MESRIDAELQRAEKRIEAPLRILILNCAR